MSISVFGSFFPVSSSSFLFCLIAYKRGSPPPRPVSNPTSPVSTVGGGSAGQEKERISLLHFACRTAQVNPIFRLDIYIFFSFYPATSNRMSFWRINTLRSFLTPQSTYFHNAKAFVAHYEQEPESDQSCLSLSSLDGARNKRIFSCKKCHVSHVGL